MFQRRLTMGVLPEGMAASAQIQKPPARRPGFFGRMGNRLANADWQMAFAQLRDDPSFAENLLSHRENAANVARQEAVTQSENRTAKGENAAREAFFATLSPEQLLLARIAPGAAVTDALRRQRGPDYRRATDEELSGYRPGTRGQTNTLTGELDITQQPESSGAGGGGVQYRPILPEEAQAYGLPHNGAGYVMGSNGRPMRMGVPNQMSADQRVRVEIGIEPALEAVRLIDNLETNSGRLETRRSPRNEQWGASVIDMMDGQGTGAVSRNMGGAEYQRYTSAGSAFETAMLPILSGAAVTPTEAQRLIRSALPQLGDGPSLLADKARRRQQMVNGAAMLSGREVPFRDVGVPEWANTYQRAQESVGGDGSDAPDGVTQEEWDAMSPEDRALWQQ